MAKGVFPFSFFLAYELTWDKSKSKSVCPKGLKESPLGITSLNKEWLVSQEPFCQEELGVTVKNSGSTLSVEIEL